MQISCESDSRNQPSCDQWNENIFMLEYKNETNITQHNNTKQLRFKLYIINTEVTSEVDSNLVPCL